MTVATTLSTMLERQPRGEEKSVQELLTWLQEVGKDLNLEAGGLQRITLDRHSPLYRLIYNQRTSCERINSQAQALGIERPKARNIRSIRTLNTLIYLTINLKALERARQINASLLPIPRSLSPTG